jgi:hypothetical protein
MQKIAYVWLLVYGIVLGHLACREEPIPQVYGYSSSKDPNISNDLGKTAMASPCPVAKGPYASYYLQPGTRDLTWDGTPDVAFLSPYLEFAQEISPAEQEQMLTWSTADRSTRIHAGDYPGEANLLWRSSSASEEWCRVHLHNLGRRALEYSGRLQVRDALSGQAIAQAEAVLTDVDGREIWRKSTDTQGIITWNVPEKLELLTVFAANYDYLTLVQPVSSKKEWVVYLWPHHDMNSAHWGGLSAGIDWESYADGTQHGESRGIRIAVGAAAHAEMNLPLLMGARALLNDYVTSTPQAIPGKAEKWPIPANMALHLAHPIQNRMYWATPLGDATPWALAWEIGLVQGQRWEAQIRDLQEHFDMDALKGLLVEVASSLSGIALAWQPTIGIEHALSGEAWRQEVERLTLLNNSNVVAKSSVLPVLPNFQPTMAWSEKIDMAYPAITAAPDGVVVGLVMRQHEYSGIIPIGLGFSVPLIEDKTIQSLNLAVLPVVDAEKLPGYSSTLLVSVPQSELLNVLAGKREVGGTALWHRGYPEQNMFRNKAGDWPLLPEIWQAGTLPRAFRPPAPTGQHFFWARFALEKDQIWHIMGADQNLSSFVLPKPPLHWADFPQKGNIDVIDLRIGLSEVSWSTVTDPDFYTAWHWQDKVQSMSWRWQSLYEPAWNEKPQRFDDLDDEGDLDE